MSWQQVDSCTDHNHLLWMSCMTPAEPDLQAAQLLPAPPFVHHSSASFLLITADSLITVQRPAGQR